jgi:hypothetical protein
MDGVQNDQDNNCIGLDLISLHENTHDDQVEDK